jgi:hypothetical protein
MVLDSLTVCMHLSSACEHSYFSKSQNLSKGLCFVGYIYRNEVTKRLEAIH